MGTVRAFPGSQQAVQEEGGGLLPVPAGHVQAAELDAVHAGGLEEPEQGRQVITAVVVHLDQEGKAGTTGVPDSQQDPADQPEPILQAAAIGISRWFPPEIQEAGEQIIVGTVDLDPIKARHLGRPGRMAELFHQPVQQLGREIAGEGRPPVDAGARLPPLWLIWAMSRAPCWWTRWARQRRGWGPSPDPGPPAPHLPAGPGPPTGGP